MIRNFPNAPDNPNKKPRAKICGLKDEASVRAAVAGGAAFAGFTFFEKSPRSVTPTEARALTALIPDEIYKTGLFVTRSPEQIAAICTTAGLTAIQLHGTYKAAEILRVKHLTGLPVLWAHGISGEADFQGISAEVSAADLVLFDAKPPKGSDRPGGNAVAFDWGLLTNRSFEKPWMLAGGLTPDNVAGAIRTSGAALVDVASGVESAPGVKDPALIRSFLKAVRNL